MLSQMVLVLWNILPYMALLFNVIQSEEFSIVLERELLIDREPPFELIYREPPVENDGERDDGIEEHFITQRLDNFDHQNNGTFQMRYLQNDEHFKPGGPIFIFIGGEWKISHGHISAGQHIYDLAKEFEGILFYTEHRYYGKTIPTKTFSMEDLKYLTVEQSLADLAHFIEKITNNKQLNATGGVILVGGSYAATIAVWFRQKYPHLVKGAWASSAPLKAKLNYFEYTETVGNSIRKIGGRRCYNKIKQCFRLVNDLLKNGDLEIIKKLFMVCDNFNITNKYDVWYFVSQLENMFLFIVQYHKNGYIESYCKILREKSRNETDEIPNHELYSFAKLFRNFFNQKKNSTCFSWKYEKLIKALKEDNTTLASKYRPWFYQTCSEFGWYQTTDSNNQPFGIMSPVQFNVDLCYNVFGDVFKNATVLESNIEHTNVMYGGFKPAVTNVYFTHGSLDPWHPMGVLEDLNVHSPANVVPGVSHCRDLGSINYKDDSKQMIESKITAQNLIKKWLKF